MNKKLRGVYTIEATLTVPIFVITVLTATLLFKLISTFSYAESLSTLAVNDLNKKFMAYSSYELGEFLYSCLDNETAENCANAESSEKFYDLITTDFRENRYYLKVSKEDFYSMANDQMSENVREFILQNPNMGRAECEEHLRFTFDRILKNLNSQCKNENLKLSCVKAQAEQNGDIFQVTFSVKVEVALPFGILGRNTISSDDEICIPLFSI